MLKRSGDFLWRTGNLELGLKEIYCNLKIGFVVFCQNFYYFFLSWKPGSGTQIRIKIQISTQKNEFGARGHYCEGSPCLDLCARSDGGQPGVHAGLLLQHGARHLQAPPLQPDTHCTVQQLRTLFLKVATQQFSGSGIILVTDPKR